MRLYILTLFFSLTFNNLCFAQPVSQIERSQEILEQEKILREKIEQEEKVFIKKIIVKGTTQVSEEQIKEIILPYQKKWLTKNDIQCLIDSFKECYQKQVQEIPAISYKIEGRKLIIEVTQEKR